ncbi:hypothetical protein CDL15_Pgr023529 [Punica granatum]|uniref:HTH myb-type domain-containing protein n=1 Tax=Punica granatum TaxID=22663 RepID=A0A218W6R9_PUNGR|nr:hypothetical protein CDL15_Pgr023529 [Punica granatum]
MICDYINHWWSLIAARLPGRTANDLKNFWNTHVVKKGNASRKDLSHHQKHKPQNPVKVNVIKPRPRTFKTAARIRPEGEATTLMASPPGWAGVLHGDEHLSSKPPAPPHQSQPASLENEVTWWESLFPLSDKSSDEEGSRGMDTTSHSLNTNSNSCSLLCGHLWSREMVDDYQQQHDNGWNNEFFDDMALSWWEVPGVSNQIIV